MAAGTEVLEEDGHVSGVVFQKNVPAYLLMPEADFHGIR